MIENYLMSDEEKEIYEKRQAIAKDILKGKTYDEIRAEHHCSAATISNVKRLMKKEEQWKH